MAALAALPLRANHALGALLGEIAWLARTRARRISEINLALCLPERSDRERRRLARRSLRETGKTLTESAWLWCRPRAFVERHVREVHGGEILERARAGGRGVLAVTPHLGSWELCNLPFSLTGDITYLYRPPRNPVVEPMLLAGRANLGGRPARLDPAGIRTVIGELRSNGTVGVLPDQEPDAGAGTFAPFFGTPALTMTLLAKLAARTDPTVLFVVSERLPRARGWRVHFLEAEPGIGDADRTRAAAALNRSVERCIALCPEQYLWSYRRFRELPEGGRRPYR